MGNTVDQLIQVETVDYAWIMWGSAKMDLSLHLKAIFQQALLCFALAITQVKCTCNAN